MNHNEIAAYPSEIRPNIMKIAGLPDAVRSFHNFLDGRKVHCSKPQCTVTNVLPGQYFAIDVLLEMDAEGTVGDYSKWVNEWTP